MEQCISRLDVAMFNAILRESANEMPTDPVSDPIIDAKVLPIPAGDLSFGSGAQLKNSVRTTLLVCTRAILCIRINHFLSVLWLLLDPLHTAII